MKASPRLRLTQRCPARRFVSERRSVSAPGFNRGWPARLAVTSPCHGPDRRGGALELAIPATRRRSLPRLSFERSTCVLTATSDETREAILGPMPTKEQILDKI